MKMILILSLILVTGMFPGCTGQSPDSLRSNPVAEKQFREELHGSRQWPSFRGCYARGFLDDVSLPGSWDVERMENIRWKIPIPGLGLSCPVVWDETIFLTTAVSASDRSGIKTGIYGDGEPVDDDSEHRWMVMAISKENGEVLWSRIAHTGIPEVKRHPKSSHANPTVATDGTHVIAFFGSEGLYCYNFAGDQLWERDFGLLKSSPHGAEWAEWEFASSPIIHRNRVIIQADVQDNSFIAAIDIRTGEIIWKGKRDDWPTWSTPNIYYHDGHARIAVNGYRHRGGYDLETGKEVWSMSGGGDVPVPTPVLYNDLVLFNSAHGKESPILAIHTDAEGKIGYPRGDSPQDPVAWFIERGGAYLQTMLVYRDLLYNFRWNGNLTCLDAATGEELYSETVDTKSFIASPVAADGNIYLVSEEGNVYILEAGPEFRIMRTIPLGEVTLATPAITEEMILFRTTGHLIAVGGN